MIWLAAREQFMDVQIVLGGELFGELLVVDEKFRNALTQKGSICFSYPAAVLAWWNWQ